MVALFIWDLAAWDATHANAWTWAEAGAITTTASSFGMRCCLYIGFIIKISSSDWNMHRAEAEAWNGSEEWKGTGEKRNRVYLRSHFALLLYRFVIFQPCLDVYINKQLKRRRGRHSTYSAFAHRILFSFLRLPFFHRHRLPIDVVFVGAHLNVCFAQMLCNHQIKSVLFWGHGAGGGRENLINSASFFGINLQFLVSHFECDFFPFFLAFLALARTLSVYP